MPEPRIFQAGHTERRSPDRPDRRADGRTLQERLASALAEGLAEGMKAGEERAKEEMAGLMRALAEARRQIEGTREEMLDATVESVARLAVKIAEKILSERIESDPGTIRTLVESAVVPLRGCGPIEVRIAAADADRCIHSGVSLHVSEGLTIVPDESLPSGSCRVRTEWGGADAGIEDQLRRVAEIFEAEAKRD